MILCIFLWVIILLDLLGDFIWFVLLCVLICYWGVWRSVGLCFFERFK